MRTDRLHHEFGAEFRWTVFPLHPETPPEGMELSRLFAGRERVISEMEEQLARQAVAEGLPLLARRTRTYNSRLAQELGKWAELRGLGGEYRRAVYQAYFVDGVNIAREEELLRICQAVGLPEEEARGVLGARDFAAAVDADWQRSRDLRVTAVPTHLHGARRLEGFAPYADFVRLIGMDRGVIGLSTPLS